MTNYLLSAVAGLLFGTIYALFGIRSPAPPIIALVGLLGMLLGEATVNYLRGHPEILGWTSHAKTFVAEKDAPTKADAAKRE